MRFHTALAITDQSQADLACEAAGVLARASGLDVVAINRTSVVATAMCEMLATAGGGRLLLACLLAEDGTPFIEILSLAAPSGEVESRSVREDRNADESLVRALDFVRHQSDLCDRYSVPMGGTVVLARIGPQVRPGASAPKPVLTYGGVCVPVKGESVSGDAWLVATKGAQASVMLADGVGHGPGAAEAANAAIKVFAAAPFLMPSKALGHAHLAVRGMQGAAVAIAHADPDSSQIIFCGAGNVAGRIISGVSDRGLMSQNGTVGQQMRTLKDEVFEWPAHSHLILHSDGIITRWNLDDCPGLLRHHPTVIAAWVLLNHSRGPDDATVVVIRRR